MVFYNTSVNSICEGSLTLTYISHFLPLMLSFSPPPQNDLSDSGTKDTKGAGARLDEGSE